MQDELFPRHHRNEVDVPVWQTTGEPRLVIIGAHRMGFEITPRDGYSRLAVFIDYRLPARGLGRWLGLLLGGAYARWCTRRMTADAVHAFAHPATARA
jgi:hypothetical protein